MITQQTTSKKCKSKRVFNALTPKNGLIKDN